MTALLALARRAVGRAWLAVFGWKPEGETPPGKCVLIAAPHTSNWDFPFTIALAWVFGIRIRWAGKHTLFRFPFGIFMRALGGVPIERHKRTNRVQGLAALFEQLDNLVLIIPAEGTRARVEHWKSGFYHVARTARVPIVCGYLDFARKRGGFGLAIVPSGDLRADMRKIRAFYADKIGKHPEKFGPVRLVEEDTEVDGAAPV